MGRTARTLIGHESEVYGWNISFTFQNATGERSLKIIAQCTLNFVILRIESSNVFSFCGLVVRVSGYRSRGPGLDSRPYQIF
jgi:hypothetical protein